MEQHKSIDMKNLYTVFVTIGSGIAGCITYLRVKIGLLWDGTFSIDWGNVKAYSWALLVAGSSALVAAVCKKLGDDIYDKWKNRKKKKNY